MNLGRMRLLWIGLLTLSSVLGGCDKLAKSKEVEKDHETPVVVREIEVGERQEVRLLTGDVTAWELLPLSFKVGGRLSKVLVEEGEKVERKQLVAVMDARDYWLTRNLARAQVEALQPHLNRAKALYKAKALPKSELDKLTGKMKAARIQQRQAQTQLSYVRLRSPISGIILKKMVVVGDMVGPSRPVIAVAKMDKVKVVFPVPQGDLAHFKRGMTMELEAAGVRGSFEGKVHHVGYAADASTRTFPVTLAVPNPKRILRAGMIVSARVKVAVHKGVFIPLSAVSRNIEGTPTVLVVGADGKAVLREVSLGVRVGEDIKVTKGLTAGDRVIVKGMVTPGDPVKASKKAAD